MVAEPPRLGCALGAEFLFPFPSPNKLPPLPSFASCRNGRGGGGSRGASPGLGKDGGGGLGDARLHGGGDTVREGAEQRSRCR